MRDDTVTGDLEPISGTDQVLKYHVKEEDIGRAVGGPELHSLIAVLHVA